MDRVSVNGIRLATREWPGGGGLVVAIHGLTANHTCWYPLADTVAPAHRLVAYDLRGRGDSDKPPRGYDLATHGADLLALLDHLGAQRATIMGHSLGAKIAVRFAAHHPERVERVVLVDGGFDLRAEVFDSLGPAIARLGTTFPSREEFLARMRALPMFAGRWNAHLERYFAYDAEPVPGGGVRARAARAAIEEELAALARARLWVWHHRVAAPTLLFRAPEGLLTATDCLMTPEEAEAMARAIPRCRLVEVAGANHYTILLADQPVVRSALADFLAA